MKVGSLTYGALYHELFHPVIHNSPFIASNTEGYSMKRCAIPPSRGAKLRK